MKEKRQYTDPDEVKREMQKVADELGLPFNSCRVAMNGQYFLLAAKTIIAFFVTFFFIFYDFFLISYNYIVRR